MGYMRHHTIVVTSWDAPRIEAAHTKALELFERRLVSEITPLAVNHYRSFFIAPDGSKEGWPESDENDEARQAFIEYLQDVGGGEDGYIDWVAVQFGDDEHETKLIDDSDRPYRT
jgi:hypothetical protein